MRTNVFIFLFIFILLYSCEKRIFDYRNKYTGDYSFHSVSSSWMMSQGTYSTDSSSYSGRVYYDRKTRDKIKISYKPSVTMEFMVSKEGELFLGCGTKIGSFEADRIIIDYATNSCPGGGMGGGTNYHIDGYRK